MPTYASSRLMTKHSVDASHVGAVILADDLTGACDAAAPFVAAGFSGRVWLGEKPLHAAAESVYPDRIPRALASGATVLVWDACTQQDLDAFAAVEIPGLLYSGSAGLATALARRRPVPRLTAPHLLPPVERVLTLCGTMHAVTQGQTRRLSVSHPGHPCLQIRLEADEMERIVNESSLRRPDAVILTGGDTAKFVLRALYALSIRLCGELAPGMPWGVVHGGLADGCLVVTKSGGFGTPDALTHILHTPTGNA
jgi:uncharacterized protein YgbK (DUF1537 family)